MKIDWVKKLTSRKFWAALIGFVTPILTAFGVSDNTQTQIVAIITGGSVLLAYILAEGFIDAKTTTTTTDDTTMVASAEAPKKTTTTKKTTTK